MTLTPADLQALLASFDASAWDEMTLTLHGEQVQLSKTGRPPAVGTQAPHQEAPERAGGRSPGLFPATGARLPDAVAAGAVGSPAEVAPVPAVEAADRLSETMLEHTGHVHRVPAPSVGVFWRSPEPSAPPFVEAGQRVEPEDVVCIVEVMKLFNHVQAGVSGTIRSIEVENAAMVEHGQTLFVVELDA